MSGELLDEGIIRIRLTYRLVHSRILVFLPLLGPYTPLSVNSIQILFPSLIPSLYTISALIAVQISEKEPIKKAWKIARNQRQSQEIILNHPRHFVKTHSQEIFKKYKLNLMLLLASYHCAARPQPKCPSSLTSGSCFPGNIQLLFPNQSWGRLPKIRRAHPSKA